MPNKNIFYDIGNSKVRDVTSSYYDDNNKLFSEKLNFSSASLNLNNGVLFTNNGLFSSSVQTQDQILAWDSANARWNFLNQTPAAVSTIPVPANSDITGSFLNNATVKSLSNVQTGTLPIIRGGTGLEISDYPTGERIPVSNGTNKLTFAESYSGSSATVTTTLGKAFVLANLTASSATDQSIYNNTISIIKGQFVTPPTPPPLGSSNALSSSYDATAANYPAHVNVSSYDGNFTMECWAYMSSVGGSGDPNFRSGIISDNNNYYVAGASGGAYSTSGVYCFFNGSTVTQTSISFIPNQWVHIALVRDGYKLKMYVNSTGSQISTIPLTNTSPMTKLLIGTAAGGNGNWNINGFVTEAKYVKYAKNPDEIKSYYQSVIAGTRGRYTKDEIDTRSYSTNNIAITINNDGTSVTGSAVRIDNISYSHIGSYYYP